MYILFSGKYESGPGNELHSFNESGACSISNWTESSSVELQSSAELTTSFVDSNPHKGDILTESRSAGLMTHTGELTSTVEMTTISAESTAHKSDTSNSNIIPPVTNPVPNYKLAHIFQLLQKSVQTTYDRLEQVHVEKTKELEKSEIAKNVLESEIAILRKKHEEDTLLVAKIENQL